MACGFLPGKLDDLNITGNVDHAKGPLMNTSPNIFFMAHPGHLQDWFWRGRSRERAVELGYEVRLNHREGPLNSEEWAELLVGVQALLTTWGSPRLDEEVLSKNDTLEIVGHVGGSLAGIASPVLYDRGIKVCTANKLDSGENCLAEEKSWA